MSTSTQSAYRLEALYRFAYREVIGDGPYFAVSECSHYSPVFLSRTPLGAQVHLNEWSTVGCVRDKCRGVANHKTGELKLSPAKTAPTQPRRSVEYGLADRIERDRD